MRREAASSPAARLTSRGKIDVTDATPRPRHRGNATYPALNFAFIFRNTIEQQIYLVFYL
jgi:hypothetical protein